MPIYREKIAVTGATGGAGVATKTGTSTRVIEGKIIAIHLEYLDSPPNTTDVTITESSNSPATPILTVTDAATNGWFYPAVIPVSVANAAITNAHRPVMIADYVSVVIAQANDADGVNATIVWDSERS